MKYKILVDNRTQGWSFREEEYDSVNEAVHAAVEDVTYAPWLIVQVVEWRASEPQG